MKAVPPQGPNGWYHAGDASTTMDDEVKNIMSSGVQARKNYESTLLTVSYLRRLVAGFSPWRLGSIPH
jgi:hypothetical protein